MAPQAAEMRVQNLIVTQPDVLESAITIKSAGASFTSTLMDVIDANGNLAMVISEIGAFRAFIAGGWRSSGDTANRIGFDPDGGTGAFILFSDGTTVDGQIERRESNGALYIRTGSPPVDVIEIKQDGTVNILGTGGTGFHSPVTIGADGEHSLAGQVLSGVDAGAAQKGHASFSSKFSVASGAVDLAADGHGASVHTNRTRRWGLYSRGDGLADGATNANVGSVPAALPILRCADAASQGVIYLAHVPMDAVAAQPLNAIVYWAPQASVGGTTSVRWEITALVINGVAVSGAGTTTTWTSPAQAHTIAVEEAEASQQILASVSAGDRVRIEVRRLGSDGADTMTTGADQIGIQLLYTADM